MQVEIERLLSTNRDSLVSSAKTIFDKFSIEEVVEFENKGHWFRAVCEVFNQLNISMLYEESSIDTNRIFNKNYKEGKLTFEDFLNSIEDILNILLSQNSSNLQLGIENRDVAEPQININETPNSILWQGNFEDQEISNEPTNVLEVENFDEIETQINETALSPQDTEKICNDSEAMIKIKKYLDDTGLYSAFQLIFAEILSKNIEPHDAFSYAAARIRQIGKEVANLLPQEYRAEKTIES